MELKGSLPHSQVSATVHILNQLDPVHGPTSKFLKTHLNIILLSTPESSKWSLSLRFPHLNPVYTSPLPIQTTFPTRLIILNLVTRTILLEEYRTLSFSICSYIHSPITSYPIGINILLSTLLSNTLSLGSSLNVSNQVSNPYKKNRQIIVLYILVFKFLDSKLEYKRFCTQPQQAFLYFNLFLFSSWIRILIC